MRLTKAVEMTMRTVSTEFTGVTAEDNGAVLDPAATSGDMRDRLKRIYPPPKSQWIALAFIAPAVILVAVFFLAPLVMAFWMSLHNWPLMGEPKFIGVANYIRLASDRGFLNALLFTGKYTFLVTVAIFIIAFPLALFVDRKSRLTGFFRSSYFLPSVVGFATSCLLWVWLLSPDNGLFSIVLQRLGWVDKPVQFIASYNLAFFSIIVMVVWRMAGFTMLLLLTGIQAIPPDIQEVARIDGATGWQRFWRITFPLMKRTLALTMVMSTYSYKSLAQDSEPDRRVRTFWSVLFILLPIALVFNQNSMNSLQSVSIIAAFPISIILVLITVSFIKDAREHLS
jgi:multiple sugar transport system permease protein